MEIKVLNSLFDFIVWLEPKIAVFPRNYRYTLGNRIEETLYSTMEYFIEARFSKKKKNLLIKANVNIEKLRCYFRICFRLKIISEKIYGSASSQLNEIGKQTGGWLKDAGERNA
jgi:hypothetical protein